MRKGMGKEARLSFMGHAATPSWRTATGWLTDFVVSRATGTAERDAVRCPATGGFIPTPWGS